jgi:hypothetical protein
VVSEDVRCLPITSQELQVELTYSAVADPIAAYESSGDDVTQFLMDVAKLPALQRLAVHAVRRSVTLHYMQHTRLEWLSLYCQHLNIKTTVDTATIPQLKGLHLAYETAPSATASLSLDIIFLQNSCTMSWQLFSSSQTLLWYTLKATGELIDIVHVSEEVRMFAAEKDIILPSKPGKPTGLQCAGCISPADGRCL